ncbi:hypothetical protein [Tengunoibacter tsumagoiensis]|nr:hypothetical protein [Tengunoibacter tsumagoiensis]
MHFVPASEIQRMRERLEQEAQGARNGLYGFSVVSSHEAITARMERMYDYLKGLQQAGKHDEVRAFLMNDRLWTEKELFDGSDTRSS